MTASQRTNWVGCALSRADESAARSACDLYGGSDRRPRAQAQRALEVLEGISGPPAARSPRASDRRPARTVTSCAHASVCTKIYVRGAESGAVGWCECVFATLMSRPHRHSAWACGRLIAPSRAPTLITMCARSVRPGGAWRARARARVVGGVVRVAAREEAERADVAAAADGRAVVLLLGVVAERVDRKRHVPRHRVTEDARKLHHQRERRPPPREAADDAEGRLPARVDIAARVEEEELDQQQLGRALRREGGRPSENCAPELRAELRARAPAASRRSGRGGCQSSRAASSRGCGRGATAASRARTAPPPASAGRRRGRRAGGGGGASTPTTAGRAGRRRRRRGRGRS